MKDRFSRQLLRPLFLFIIILAGAVSSYAQKKRIQVPVIFDTDMGPDYDDVGAITLLHAFADSGYIRILATVASTRYEGVAGVLNVLNSYFNRPEIRIGVPKAPASLLRDTQHWTDTLLAKYPHVIKSNEEVDEAVSVYRRALSGQPKKSVTIITVGFLTNLASLLESEPDQFSPLDGEALVRQKVKQLVCMAGSFPTGSEFNLKEDAGASKFVFAHWTSPVIFSGVEIGWKIRTGLPLINNNKISNSPVKDVFRICIPLSAEDSAGRMSWDETAVLVAIKGTAPWFGTRKGTIIVADDGSDTWVNRPTTQSYLLASKPAVEVARLINKLLQHQPMIRN